MNDERVPGWSFSQPLPSHGHTANLPSINDDSALPLPPPLMVTPAKKACPYLGNASPRQPQDGGDTRKRSTKNPRRRVRCGGFFAKGRNGAFCLGQQTTFYIMPSMPPMPPPMPAAGASSFGDSATMHSVVSIKPATEAAFCSAVRVTLVGSRIPISIMSP